MSFIDLRTKHFQDIVDPMKSTSTAQMFKNVIKMLYQYALKHDIVNKDYSAYIEMPNAKKKNIKKPFTKEEINLLWNHQGTDAIDVLLILLYSGMRISEVLNMKIEDIKFEERYMIGGVKTEAGKNRIIPIHKEIAPIIKQRLSNKYLFQGVRSGNKYDYSYMSILISKEFKELKMDHTIHETRHTFVSQADRLNINKITIKKIVGHSVKGNDITNDVYTHKNKEDVIEAIDLFYY
jgi:integrase